MRRAVTIILPLILAACAGGGIAGFMPGEEVTVGGDVFTVSIEGKTAMARNFATGIRNQDRLYTNAQEAIRIASDCDLATFAQEPGVNTYRARLACGAE